MISMEKTAKVSVAGHVCLDITPKITNHGAVSDILSPGKLISVDDASVTAGGVVGNTGLALNALGIDTNIQCKVGNDQFGAVTKSFFEQQGTDNHIKITDEAKSSFTIALSVPGADRILIHNCGANDTFGSDDIDYSTVKKSALFHFGYPTLMRKMRHNEGEEVRRVFKKIREYQIPVSMDLTLPEPQSESGTFDWDGFLQKTLPLVDIFTPSFEEILFMLNKTAYSKFRAAQFKSDPLENLDISVLRDLGNKIIKYGSAVALIKCGIKGLYIKTADLARLKNTPFELFHSPNWGSRELFCESYRVQEFVCATGAGDSCIAGFIAALLNGRSIEKALKIAASTGAKSLGSVDSFSSLGSFEQVEAYAEKTSTQDTFCAGGSWSYDKINRIWTIR
ncbi:carbohydrate kinase family protein [Chitinispirillales bacterium ANBcel5]|uniref:carbohydrate kinase family protein n=1 Tax=Cellulosispirillum alkaliphilum TaxID=3039283 RepID=UPI002A543A9B|nr:carbohydrate kinase family protein [Chitinispirillales bacterium ANBcel5]